MDQQIISTINDRFATCLQSLKKILPDSGYEGHDAISYGNCASTLTKMVSSDSRLTKLPLDELVKILDNALLEAFAIYTHNVSRLSSLTRPQEYEARHSITLIAKELIAEFLKSR